MNQKKLIIAIMLGIIMASVGVVSLNHNANDNTYEATDEVGELTYDLNKAVDSYNRAVMRWDSEDMWVYIEEIDRIVEELEALGMWVEFKSRIIPLTVSVSVKPATDEQKQSWSYSVTANEEQLETIRELWGQDITRGEFMEKVFPESLEDMPEDILEGLYETKITWPDSSDQPGSMKCSLVWFRNITDFFWE